MAPDLGGPNQFHLVWTRANQEQVSNNLRAEELMATIESKLGEWGVTSFWDTTCESDPRVAHNQRQFLCGLPPFARCNCLEAMQASLSAMETPAETPEPLRTFAEQTLESFHLQAWRHLALSVVAVADPCALVTRNAAVAGAGVQQASLQLPLWHGKLLFCRMASDVQDAVQNVGGGSS